MALFNYATKEITIKVVYYGPGLSGKTTNLQYLHSVLDAQAKGKLLSLATEADRTLFFDFLPVEIGKIRDFSIRFQLYTVPGQVRYNATRRLVLKGADAVVFVADSQREMKEQNIESLNNMYENLISNNINPDEIPIILQYNKRDLKNVLSIEELSADLNSKGKYQYTESVALEGIGVENTFQHITKLVLKGIAERHKVKVQSKEEVAKAAEILEAPAEKVEVEKPVLEEPSLKTKVTESSRYEIELAELKEPLYEAGYEKAEKKEIPTEKIKEEEDIFAKVPDMEEARGIPGEIPVERFKEEEDIPTREPDIEEVMEIPKEVPSVSDEKLESIIDSVNEVSNVLKDIKKKISDEKKEALVNNINELSKTLNDMKKEISELQTQVKDIIKYQRDMNVSLRDIRRSFEDIKEKKSWFKFS
jgi:signal recognition particle receptor subunit beta